MYGQARQSQKRSITSDRFLPKELLTKCITLVESIHKEHGFLNLPSRMWTKQNMGALAMVDDRGMVILGNATFGWKLRIGLWVFSVVIFGFAWFFSWWIILGLVAVVVVDQICARLNKRYWRFLAAMLLSLEVLVNDFAGWGTAYPEAQIHALQALGMQTQWLDLYLPSRANIDAETLRRFGPSNPHEDFA